RPAERDGDRVGHVRALRLWFQNRKYAPGGAQYGRGESGRRSSFGVPRSGMLPLSRSRLIRSARVRSTLASRSSRAETRSSRFLPPTVAESEVEGYWGRGSVVPKRGSSGLFAVRAGRSSSRSGARSEPGAGRATPTVMPGVIVTGLGAM